MIISPQENTPYMSGLEWVQKRPRVTQLFGKDFLMSNGKYAYESMGMKGHNGVDIGLIVGTPLYSPMDGEYKAIDSGLRGYGKHFRIRNKYKKLELVIGHLSDFFLKSEGKVTQGDLIGYSGNTGFSTAPHCHIGGRSLSNTPQNIWEATILNYNNGYFGYWDIAPYVITYKGTLLKNTIH